MYTAAGTLTRMSALTPENVEAVILHAAHVVGGRPVLFVLTNATAEPTPEHFFVASTLLVQSLHFRLYRDTYWYIMILDGDTELTLPATVFPHTFTQAYAVIPEKGEVQLAFGFGNGTSHLVLRALP